MDGAAVRGGGIVVREGPAFQFEVFDDVAGYVNVQAAAVVAVVVVEARLDGEIADRFEVAADVEAQAAAVAVGDVVIEGGGGGDIERPFEAVRQVHGDAAAVPGGGVVVKRGIADREAGDRLEIETAGSDVKRDAAA